MAGSEDMQHASLSGIRINYESKSSIRDLRA